MTVYTKPEVILDFITPDAEKWVERFARICYDSYDKITDESYGQFCRKLIDRQHEDCLECASATFYIRCDRATQNQLVRHRHMTFQVRSQRYCNEEDFNFYIPPAITGPMFKEVWETVDDIARLYRQLIAAGIRKEDARCILPNCTATELNANANLRSWRHFLVERGAKAAQLPIRQIATRVAQQLKIYCPNLFFDFEIDTTNYLVTKVK